MDNIVEETIQTIADHYVLVEGTLEELRRRFESDPQNDFKRFPKNEK